MKSEKCTCCHSIKIFLKLFKLHIFEMLSNRPHNYWSDLSQMINSWYALLFFKLLQWKHIDFVSNEIRTKDSRIIKTGPICHDIFASQFFCYYRCFKILVIVYCWRLKAFNYYHLDDIIGAFRHSVFLSSLFKSIFTNNWHAMRDSEKFSVNLAVTASKYMPLSRALCIRLRRSERVKA